MEKQYRIALLIDAENVSKKYIKLIMDEISGYGVITYKRVYGDFTNPGVSAWKGSLIEFAMTPVFQLNYTKGKNASDSAMVIDAMDILYSGRVDGFCLVTSDSDFTKLAVRLREAGMLVIGMGEQKTPASLVAACETFKYLDLLYHDEDEEDSDSEEESVADFKPVENEAVNIKCKEPATADTKNGKNTSNAKNARSTEAVQEKKAKNSEQKSNTAENAAEDTEDKKGIPSKEEMKNEISSIIISKSDEDGWVNLAEIGNLLSKRIPGFDPRNYGFEKLKAFIESFACYEIQEVPNSRHAFLKIIYVRIK